jgi:predicted RNA-binding Zn-ribbon protein involved in translation (DUF1610 family)
VESATEGIADHQGFPCSQCGADLEFSPGTTSLVCPHCGAANQIVGDAEPVAESDYRAALAELAAGEPSHEKLAVKCSSCGAESALPPDVTADKCPFCGAGLVAEKASRKLIRPQYLLPFHVTREQTMDAFRSWISSRWFAPSALQRSAQAGRLSGIYMPVWTFNSDTTSRYTGERGDDYWETEHYTTHENGKMVTRTRQVRKTRWHDVSGCVQRSFADLLIRASDSLPEDSFHALEPWDLQHLMPYNEEYLAGFVCESYQHDLPAAFEHAREDMVEPIRQTIREDIGGDHQRIHDVSTRYSNITFKHVLLPVWLSAYQYHDQTYRFMVNARTGEVYGQRPYSFWKITLLVASIISAVALILILVSRM